MGDLGGKLLQPDLDARWIALKSTTEASKRRLEEFNYLGKFRDFPTRGKGVVAV